MNFSSADEDDDWDLDGAVGGYLVERAAAMRRIQKMQDDYRKKTREILATLPR